MPPKKGSPFPNDDAVFSSLPAGTSWYHETGDGAVTLRNAFKFAQQRLTHTARAALALTQIGCERGRGKVYSMSPKLVGGAEGEKKQLHASSASRSVPELFYLPVPWSDEERTQWMQTTPSNQLKQLTARHGYVGERAAVIPFALELDDISGGASFQGPLLDGQKAAELTLCIMPYVYVGLTEAMRAECREQYRRTRESGNFMGRDFIGSSWSTFQKFRLRNARAALDKFDKIFRVQVPEMQVCVTFYKTLIERFVLAAREAAEAGEPYGSAV